jgi:hypothetical protein
VPDERERKAVWRILGNPGAVLAGGAVVGTWRTAKATKTRLALTVTPFGTVAAKTRRAVAEEAQRLAELRGATSAEVQYE